MNKTRIILLLVISAVFCFINSIDRELILDDISYQFIFEDDDTYMDIDSMRPVQSVGDIFSSLSYHYMHVNGRSLPHFFVQYFDSIGGMTAFAVCNTAVFVLFILLLTHYSVRLPMRTPVSSWWYLLVVLSVFYLFPNLETGMLWFTPSYGINYLWGGMIFLLFLVLFDSSRTPLIVMILLAILIGLQNEAFGIPLCGGLVIYFIIYRNRIERRKIIILLVLIAATAVTALAPGTIERALSGDSNGHGVGGILLGAVECYVMIKIFWLYLLSLILTLIFKGRKFVTEYFRDNSLVALIFCTAVLFSVYAHSGKHSLAVVEIMSLILIVRLLKKCKDEAGQKIMLGRKMQNVLMGCIVVIFIASQTAVAVANRQMREEYIRMEKIYEQSPDGVTRMSCGNIGSPFNYTAIAYREYIRPSHYTSSKFAYLHNQHDKKLPLVLSEGDYRNLIERPDSFFTARRPVPGSAGAYECENMYVVRVDSTQQIDSGLTYTAWFDDDSFMQSLPWYRKLVYSLIGRYKAPKPLKFEVVETRHGRYILIGKILSTPTRIESSQESSL